MSRIDDPDFREQLRGWLAFSQSAPLRRWRGDNLIPPATLLECVCDSFRNGTDLPLEIPFAAVLHILSGLAAQKKITAQCGDTVIEPNVWTVVLADSGTGKSLTLKKLTEFTDDVRVDASGVASARALFDCILEQPRGLWVQDEAGQFLRWASQPDQAKLKSILLALGTGEPISWRTRGDGNLRVAEHCLSLFFLSQTELWTRHNPPESMVDGLLARFGYLIARPDPERPPRDFPLYEIDTTNWSNAWNRISFRLRTEYVVESEAVDLYREAFRSIFPRTEDIPVAFSRRLLFRTHQYALLYHMLREPDKQRIGAETYGYALRLTRTTLEEARHLIGEHNLSDLARLIAKAEALKTRIEESGKLCTPRDLIAGIWGITTVAQARGILNLLCTC